MRSEYLDVAGVGAGGVGGGGGVSVFANAEFVVRVDHTAAVKPALEHGHVGHLVHIRDDQPQIQTQKSRLTLSTPTPDS